jgi:hypothetical protein
MCCRHRVVRYGIVLYDLQYYYHADGVVGAKEGSKSKQSKAGTRGV